MTHLFFQALVIGIYLGLAFYFRRDHLPHVFGVATWLLAIALVLHGYVLYSTLFAEGINLNMANALSLIGWLTVLFYWLLNFKYPITRLHTFALPVVATLSVLPYFFARSHYLVPIPPPVLLLHIGLAMLAYGLLTLASLHAMFMMLANRALHHPTQLEHFAFPPLMAMEVLLFRLLLVGFSLLTVTLLSGMLFSEQLFGQAVQLKHKTVFSISAWFIYATLLLGRYHYGWRGRKALRLVLFGFVLLLLAYIGSKFVLEVLLGR